VSLSARHRDGPRQQRTHRRNLRRIIHQLGQRSEEPRPGTATRNRNHPPQPPHRGVSGARPPEQIWRADTLRPFARGPAVPECEIRADGRRCSAAGADGRVTDTGPLTVGQPASLRPCRRWSRR